MRHYVTVPLVLMGILYSTWADMSFYTYIRKADINTKWINNEKIYDTAITYIQRQMGYAQLEISEITITPRGSYLDIVEDAWISGSVTELNLPNITDNFMFKGSLPIPPKAAVTGLLAWKGDTCYKARLQPSKYSFDQSFLDSISLQQSLDSRIAILQQHTESFYSVAFTRIVLGERKHIRVRYLLPNNGSGAASYSIPVLFHSQSCQPPRFVKATILANDSDLSFYLSTPNGDVAVKNTVTVTIPYQQHLLLKYMPKVNSAMHITSFPGGTWKGNYVLINSEVNDSLLGKLSKPIQTVFIWRWNYPQYFITTANQMKSLSPDAYKVIEQAKSMKNAVSVLKKRGYRCGLIHSIEGQNALAFKTETIDDSSSIRAMDYLSGFDEHYLFDTYANQKSPDPAWVPQQVNEQGFIETARSDFLAQIAMAKCLLTDTVHYRHIVLLSTGVVSTVYSKNISDTLSTLLAAATIDFAGSQWRGIDIAVSEPTGMAKKLTSYLGFKFPMFFPATVQLSASNTSQPYSFPLDGIHPGAFAVTIRTESPWDTLFQWTGFSSLGIVTRTIAERPVLFRVSLDSGLAKLWAKDESHITDKEEIYPGGTFGIVNKGAYLQATTKDISSAIAQGVPFLSDEEIHAPKSALSSGKKQAPVALVSAKVMRGLLVIKAPVVITKIELYDLSGRIIETIDPAGYATGVGNYRIPLKDFLKIKGLKVIIMKITGVNLRVTVKLNLESVR